MLSKFQLQLLVALAKSKTWFDVIKPELGQMASEYAQKDTEPKNEFEAVKNQFQHLERKRTMRKVIALVEDAETQLEKLRQS